MGQYNFLITIVIILFFRWLLSNDSISSDYLAEDKFSEEGEEENQIIYLSNGYPIQGSHHEYYIRMLGLENNSGNIDYAIVDEAVEKIFYYVKDSNNINEIDLEEVLLARSFLVDQLTYMLAKN